MCEYDIYEDGIEEERYWTRRQIFITIAAVMMILILLASLTLPLIRFMLYNLLSPVIPPPTSIVPTV